MFLSSATLVIVPVTLIPHWQQQVSLSGEPNNKYQLGSFQ
jgi:hypothetical protein